MTSSGHFLTMSLDWTIVISGESRSFTAYSTPALEDLAPMMYCNRDFSNSAMSSSQFIKSMDTQSNFLKPVHWMRYSTFKNYFRKLNWNNKIFRPPQFSMTTWRPLHQISMLRFSLTFPLRSRFATTFSTSNDWSELKRDAIFEILFNFRIILWNIFVYGFEKNTDETGCEECMRTIVWEWKMERFTRTENGNTKRIKTSKLQNFKTDLSPPASKFDLLTWRHLLTIVLSYRLILRNFIYINYRNAIY